MLHIDYVLSVCVKLSVVAPTIVNIFYHNVIIAVKYLIFYRKSAIPRSSFHEYFII